MVSLVMKETVAECYLKTDDTIAYVANVDDANAYDAFRLALSQEHQVDVPADNGEPPPQRLSAG